MDRKITKFKHIIFVSNEYRKEFLRLFPNLEEKTLVLNNFIDTEKESAAKTTARAVMPPIM